MPNPNNSKLKEMGLGDKSLEGLIPGLLGDAISMNPAAIFGAFMQGGSPKCTNIHMKTRNENNLDGTQSGFVANSEIKPINPCAFVNGTNPISKQSCPTKESFVNANIKMSKAKDLIKSDFSKRKPLAELYTAAVGGLFVYLIYKMLYKSN